ncbi:MARVEL domain-containing protein 3-like [Penaeus vannamei]|uniref:MARVEL domain-containing protein 3-like n=1 Tax=Penaeus vannamei TaxID=6689 RepID=UPI00387F687A
MAMAAKVNERYGNRDRHKKTKTVTGKGADRNVPKQRKRLTETEKYRDSYRDTKTCSDRDRDRDNKQDRGRVNHCYHGNISDIRGSHGNTSNISLAVTASANGGGGGTGMDFCLHLPPLPVTAANTPPPPPFPLQPEGEAEDAPQPPSSWRTKAAPSGPQPGVEALFIC